MNFHARQLSHEWHQRTTLPEQMRVARRWLCWRLVPNADPAKKGRKVPFYASGKPRGPTDTTEDLAQLVSFEEALAAVQANGFTGPGFALGGDGTGNHYQGLDFDRPDFADFAADLGGYRELSPSGRGFKVFGYGPPFASLGSNSSGVEAYAGGRFFTVTGQGLGGELIDLSDAVERRVRPLHSPAATTPAAPTTVRPEPANGATVAEEPARIAHELSERRAGRNAALYQAANALGRLAGAGKLDPTAAHLALKEASTSNGYIAKDGMAEFEATFWSGFNAGRARPAPYWSGLTIPDAIKAGTFTVNGQPFYQTGATFSMRAQLAATTALSFPPVTLNEWLSARQSPTAIVPGHFYADVGVFVAPGGTGKTTSVLWQAVHIALGRPLWGMAVLRPGPVMVLTAEDSRELLVARLRLICAELGLTDEQTQLVAERVRIGDVSGTGFRLTTVDRDVVRPAEGPLTQLIDAAKAIGPVLMVIDPAVSFGVGESRVNDAEQGLIEAARRIVREVGCGVIYVAHSGKANAREKTLDQYSGRGGSAFADGARMVHVLQTVAPADWFAETGDELQPGETGLILARPKGSYSVPQGPLYIKRRGYRFDAFDRKARDKEQQRDDADQKVWRLLSDELAAGRYHSANSLSDLDTGLRRADLRQSLARLLAAGQLQERDRPGAQARGARKYLHPVAASGEDGAHAPEAQQETLLSHWQDEKRTTHDV